MTRTFFIIVILYIVIYSILLLYQLGMGNAFNDEISPVFTLLVFWLLGILALVAGLQTKKKHQ